MIGLLVLFGAAIYLLIGLLVIVLIAKSTKGRIIGIIILALIPTWDVIIGYPTFWYLCKFKSGMTIYKTVENVEGFYIGELRGKHEPFGPHEGFSYIDYKDDRDGKYYRGSWLDNTNSELCFKPKLNGKSYSQRNYKKEFVNGRCLVKQLLKPEQVSRYEVLYHTGWDGMPVMPLITLYKVKSVEIRDRKNDEMLSTFITYKWNTGWLNNGLSITGGKVVRSKYKGDPFKDTLNLTIKPHKGEK